MTRQERLKAIQEMDVVIERAEHACKPYELIQMEMMATVGSGESSAQTADGEEGGTAEGAMGEGGLEKRN